MLDIEAFFRRRDKMKDAAKRDSAINIREMDGRLWIVCEGDAVVPLDYIKEGLSLGELLSECRRGWLDSRERNWGLR